MQQPQRKPQLTIAPSNPINEISQPQPKTTSPDWAKEYRRPVAEIVADLSKPIPAQYLAKRKQGKAQLTYLPWHNAAILLNRCAPGWSYSVDQLTFTTDRCFIVVTLTIPAAEGDITRSATGTELLKEEATNKDTGEIFIREIAFGDPSSNAESMALRRAAAKFGLALYLYEKD